MMNSSKTSADIFPYLLRRMMSCRQWACKSIRWRFMLLIFPILGLIGCGKPFDVKPRTTVQPMPTANYAATVEASGLTLSSELIKDEDYLYDTFGGNLILAGILPVRVKLQNAGAEKIDVKDAIFTLLDTSNRAFKMMDAE